jgi:ferrochelatase
MKTAVVWVNLGTPDAPVKSAVRTYLTEFLSDTRVVEIPKAIWWLILNGIILPFRAQKSAEKYASIWTHAGSPLKVETMRQAEILGRCLEEGSKEIKVVYAMRYGSPSVPKVLSELKKEGVERILIFPAYPQYSGTTTASVMDAVTMYYQKERVIPELRFIRDYHDDEGYIHALAQSVLTHWEAKGRSDILMMSFHGVPERTIKLGDVYEAHCRRTAELLARKLGLSENQYRLTFQSRFGRAKWLSPATTDVLLSLAKEGVKRVDVICPGFAVDCLETLEEIAMEGRHDFIEAGGLQFEYIPALNSQAAWIEAMTKIVLQHTAGWPIDL